MTIHRPHYDGPITFECDNCGDGLDTDETDFQIALRMAKEAGWYVSNREGHWVHHCSKTCSDRGGPD